MGDSLRELLSHPKVDTKPPSNSTSIDAVSGRLQMPIPAAVRSLWETSDGAILREHDAELLSTAGVLELFELDVFGEQLLESGFLPLLYDLESNYVCVACKPPLAPRVIYVLHDDSPVVLYRNVDSFFFDCLELLSSSDFSALFFHESKGDFRSSHQRTTDDRSAARLLIEWGGDWDIPLATQLLDESCTHEWTKLLNGDRFARQDALLRLNEIDSELSRTVLRRDNDDFESFATQVCNAAKSADISVARNDRDASCVRVNRHWVDLNVFFGRRHIENAIPRLVDWLVDIRDGNDPNERPGNYMLD